METESIISLAIMAFSEAVSAQQLIDSIAAAAAKAKARGLRVLLGTLAPYKGSASFDASGELKRQAVNAAIRNAQAATEASNVRR